MEYKNNISTITIEGEYFSETHIIDHSILNKRRKEIKNESVKVYPELYY